MKDNLFIRQLGTYFDTYLPSIHGASKHTCAAYADAFAVFFQFLSEEKKLEHHHVTYKTFTAAMLDDFMLWMKDTRHYSAGSIRHRISAIISFLKDASRREMEALNAFSVASATELPTVVQSIFPHFTKDEMKILLALPDPHKYLGTRDLVMLSFLYDTAARAQELCDVRVGDIRFGTPTKAKLLGKGNKAREIPISDDVANLLRYYLKPLCLSPREAKEHPLFLSQSQAKMTVACVRSVVSKYLKFAKEANPGLFLDTNYSPHSFRHSKAIHMVEAGVHLVYIRNFLGHATISSTEIYARVSQDAVTKALTNRKIPSLAHPTPNKARGQYSVPDFIANARRST